MEGYQLVVLTKLLPRVYSFKQRKFQHYTVSLQRKMVKTKRTSFSLSNMEFCWKIIFLFLLHNKIFEWLLMMMMMMMMRFVACTYPPCWVLKARIQKHRGKPFLFHDKCPYNFTSHPKDEAIMVKCLAQGHKRRHRPGRDSNPHSGNTRT